MNNTKWLFTILMMSLSIIGCTSTEVKPIDIFGEDMCSQCRMAISDQSFASEIIDQQGDIFKFDDIGCLLKFKERSADLKISAIFLKDYNSKAWMPYEKSTIVETNIKTPMGSGKVAFIDSLKAKEFSAQHPMTAIETCNHSCCSEGTE